MNKENRAELREINRLQAANRREFNQAAAAIRKARKQITLDENTAKRIFEKRNTRLERRRSILEGRLA